MGLSLLEIKDFLEVHDQGDLPCDHIKEKLQDKVAVIDKQIQELMIFRQELQGLLSGWEAVTKNTEPTICPIIQRY